LIIGLYLKVYTTHRKCQGIYYEVYILRFLLGGAGSIFIIHRAASLRSTGKAVGMSDK